MPLFDEISDLPAGTNIVRRRTGETFILLANDMARDGIGPRFVVSARTGAILHLSVLLTECATRADFDRLYSLPSDDDDEFQRHVGLALRTLLGLSPRGGRYDTSVGDKTLPGLARTVARVLYDPQWIEPNLAPSR